MAVPPSFDKSKFRLIDTQARVEMISADPALTAEQQTRVASWMPKITQGEPTKLRVTAWLCHEGRNNNGLIFRAEDLPAAAEKITAPNLLPMDWNHSAVQPAYMYSEEPKAIGVWYKAECKQNPEAKGGKGALGIELEGVVWAWAFEEKATEMLAMQQQRGYVEFSMACIPTRSELGADEKGPYEVALEPVFFTLSALNLPPADPDAKGLILPDTSKKKDEDDLEDDEDDWMDQKAKAAALKPEIKEARMDENKNTAALEAALEANTVLKAEIERATAANAELVTKVAELEAALTETKTTADELAIARDALKTELEAAGVQLAALNAEFETAKAELATIAAEKARVASEQRWQARFAELPESYRAAFSKRTEDEKTRFTARWSAAADEEWNEFKSDLLVGFGDMKISYLSLSALEGNIPAASGTTSGLGATVAALTV